MAQLIQINLAFVPVEDRILLKIACGEPGAMSEFRIWLTRRFVKLLWSALEQVLDSSTNADPRIAAESKDAVKQFQQSMALSQADFATPYTSENVNVPLGPTPLLVYKLQIKNGSDDTQILFMEGITGQTINITMTIPLIYSLRKLLSEKLKEAAWDMSFSALSEEGPYFATATDSVN